MTKDFNKLPKVKKDKQAGITEKIINLLTILNMIESKEYPSIEDIARRCEVTERTAYRYLNIINFIVPLSFNKEKGGYEFLQSNSKKVITIDEREKILLKALENFLGLRDEFLRSTFEGLIKKAVICSKDQNNEGIDKLTLSIEKSIKPKEENLEKVLSAIKSKRTLMIEYHSINDNKITKREIEPVKLTFYDGIWFLYAYCKLRKDYRIFALDRMEKVEETYNKISNVNEKELEETIKKSWKIWSGDKVHRVVVRFLPEISEVIRRKPKWHESEQRDELPDGSIKLTFELNSIEEIKWFLYSFIPYVEILEPKELIDTMKKEIKNFIRLNKW